MRRSKYLRNLYIIHKYITKGNICQRLRHILYANQKIFEFQNRRKTNAKWIKKLPKQKSFTQNVHRFEKSSYTKQIIKKGEQIGLKCRNVSLLYLFLFINSSRR